MSYQVIGVKVLGITIICDVKRCLELCLTLDYILKVMFFVFTDNCGQVAHMKGDVCFTQFSVLY